jgi:hypothetical protein
MLLDDDRIRTYGRPTAELSELVLRGLAVRARRHFEGPDGVDRDGAGAAYYHVFRSPFLEPVTPINSAILRLRRMEAVQHASSALPRPPIAFHLRFYLPFHPACKAISCAKSRFYEPPAVDRGVAESVILHHCQDRARFARQFKRLGEISVIGV